jgi:hypothetical protein
MAWVTNPGAEEIEQDLIMPFRPLPLKHRGGRFIGSPFSASQAASACSASANIAATLA